MIREAGALVIVVAGFGGADAAADLRNFDDDLLIADLDILSGRVERLKDQLRKPRANKEKDQEELDLLDAAPGRAGSRQAAAQLSADAPSSGKAIKSFQLFSEKPRLIIVNTADDEAQPERFAAPGARRDGAVRLFAHAANGPGRHVGRRSATSSAARCTCSRPTATT